MSLAYDLRQDDRARVVLVVLAVGPLFLEQLLDGRTEGLALLGFPGFLDIHAPIYVDIIIDCS